MLYKFGRRVLERGSRCCRGYFAAGELSHSPTPATATAMAKSYFDGMDDPRLKPKLLSYLLHDLLPDRPLADPSHLSRLVSAVKTHSLLSESFPSSSPDARLVDRWRSAVDSWVDRCLALLSCKLPDNCWAGICLLGVTFEECSSDRFLASYSLWFQNLLSQIQPPSESQFVKVACCSALSDLFTRLGAFSSAKKDGTSLAGRLVQPILKLLTQETSESALEGCVDVLTTLVTFFPSSILRHYKDVEDAIAIRIISSKSSASISKKFSLCLALLPKSRGDEDSWSLMLQKILILVNDYLSDTFQGLEAETKKDEFGRLLVPPGKSPPPSLGGQQLAGDNRSGQVQIYNGCALMQCCCMMLTNPYPVQVPIPVKLLVSIIERTLKVDGSPYNATLPFVTVMQQELVCLELPVLHSLSLDLLVLVIKGVRSQLLPHSAHIAQLLAKFSKRCFLPSLRVKMYSAMQTLLISMGAGIALYLAEDVINNAFDDLRVSNRESGSRRPEVLSTEVPNSALVQPGQKKRKLLPKPPVLPLVESNGEGSKYVRSSSPSVQVAALQAIEALINVGGSLKSENWRSDVDHFLLMVATDACGGGCARERVIFLSEDVNSAQVDFQLAAFKALLSSILSPSSARPPCLSQALDLFCRGKQETGTKLAEFCTSAVLALEVLIHPRALPLHEFSAFTQNFSVNKMNNGTVKNVLGSFRGVNKNGEDDEFFDSCLENIEQSDMNDQNSAEDEQTRDATNQTNDSDVVRDEPMLEVNDPSANEVSIYVGTAQMKVTADSSTSHTIPENVPGEEHPLSHGKPVVRVEAAESRKRMTSTAEDLATKNASGSSGTDASEIAKVDSDSKGFFFFKGKEMKVDSDASSVDTLPDIVDADPDTSDAESE